MIKYRLTIEAIIGCIPALGSVYEEACHRPADRCDSMCAPSRSAAEKAMRRGMTRLLTELTIAMVPWLASQTGGVLDYRALTSTQQLGAGLLLTHFTIQLSSSPAESKCATIERLLSPVETLIHVLSSSSPTIRPRHISISSVRVVHRMLTVCILRIQLNLIRSKLVCYTTVCCFRKTFA